MTEYKVTKRIIQTVWCEISATDEQLAIEGAENNDVWFGDDGTEENYEDEFEVEEI